MDYQEGLSMNLHCKTLVGGMCGARAPAPTEALGICVAWLTG